MAKMWKNLGLIFLFAAFFFTKMVEAESQPHEQFEERIINGHEATREATKHQVSVRYKVREKPGFGYGHICGGSLIAPNVVLTAAHCFLNEEKLGFNNHTDYNIVMGNLNRFLRKNTLTFEINETVYSKYDFDTMENDIAIVFLNGTVSSNNKDVQPIKLNRKAIPAGTVCQVTGWGVKEYDKNSDVLRSVDVRVAHQRDYPGGNKLDEGMIAAGSSNPGPGGSCFGDSGGPLVCNLLLTGIVSTGTKCPEFMAPTVFTEIAFYSEWIDKELQIRNVKLPGNNATPIVKFSSAFIVHFIVFHSSITF